MSRFLQCDTGPHMLLQSSWVLQLLAGCRELLSFLQANKDCDEADLAGCRRYLSGVNRQGGLGGGAGAARMAKRARLADKLLQPPVLHIARQQLCAKLVA